MKVLFFIGTRPEAIKLAPVIDEFRRSGMEVGVCVSAQHREMLDQILKFFSIRPDFDLNIMIPEQSLFDITTRALRGLEGVLREYTPHWVFIQGDTTTTLMGALGGFYARIPVAHIEAGLRSFHKYSPFPEEMNRVLTSHIADLHFAPTGIAKSNLLREGINPERVYVVGNTVIDALLMTVQKVSLLSPEDFGEVFKGIDFLKRVILVTGHRRESFGEPLREMFSALRAIAETEEVEVIYPVHMNPCVQEPAQQILGGRQNIHLLPPLDYPALIWLMARCYLILTDSGGIQEEAPSLGKPVLVMRAVTERPEGIEVGTAKRVGLKKETIIDETKRLLADSEEYIRMSSATNPYGDGKASIRIREIMEREGKTIARGR
jgi:UDP-N-acetylglucosamine 2-epimerase (non-hydrolysing)